MYWYRTMTNCTNSHTRWMKKTIWFAVYSGLIAAGTTAAVSGEAVCNVATTNLAFGLYNPFEAGGLTTASTLDITCTRTGQGAAKVAYTLTLSTGRSGEVTRRFLSNTTDSLYYNVYIDPTRTRIFGNGTGGSDIVTGSFQLVPPREVQQAQTTLYAQIPANQNVSAGHYTDTLFLTVSW